MNPAELVGGFEAQNDNVPAARPLPPLFTQDTPAEDVELMVVHPCVGKRATSMLDARTTGLLAMVNQYNRFRFAEWAVYLFKVQLLASLYLPFTSTFFINRCIVYTRRFRWSPVLRQCWSASTYALRVCFRVAVFPTATVGTFGLASYAIGLVVRPSLTLLEGLKFGLFCLICNFCLFATAAHVGGVILCWYLRHFVRWSHKPAAAVACAPHPLPPVPVFQQQPQQHALNVRLSTFQIFDQVCNAIIRTTERLYNMAAAVCADSAPSSTTVDIAAFTSLDLLYMLYTLNLMTLDIVTARSLLALLALLLGRPEPNAFFAACYLLIRKWGFGDTARDFVARKRYWLGLLAGDQYAAQNFGNNTGTDWAVYFALVWKITPLRVLSRPWLRDPLKVDQAEPSGTWAVALVSLAVFVVSVGAPGAFDLWRHATMLKLPFYCAEAFLECVNVFQHVCFVIWSCAAMANILRFHIRNPIKWILCSGQKNICPVQ